MDIIVDRAGSMDDPEIESMEALKSEISEKGLTCVCIANAHVVGIYSGADSAWDVLYCGSSVELVASVSRHLNGGNPEAYQAFWNWACAQ